MTKWEELRNGHLLTQVSLLEVELKDVQHGISRVLLKRMASRSARVVAELEERLPTVLYSIMHEGWQGSGQKKHLDPSHACRNTVQQKREPRATERHV